MKFSMGSTMGIVNRAAEMGALLLSLTGAMLPGVKHQSMLHQVSWQQFLTAAFVLSLVWYAALFLFFYRGRKKSEDSGKMRSLFPGGRKIPVVREEEVSALAAEEGLMGKPRLPEGMARVGSHELLFADQAVEGNDKVRRLGLIPDVIEELKEIFRVLEAEQGTKQDFMELFALLKMKFPGIKHTPEEKTINAYIRENALFPLSDAELEALWD